MQSKKIRPSHITDAAARSGGNVAAATELASSTEAVASCQQGVEAKTRHLHKHCTEDHDDNQESTMKMMTMMSMANYQDGKEREAEPPFSKMTITWVTSANVVVCGGKVQVGKIGKPAALTCEVLVLVVAMVEQTLGTGETAHALDPLPQHVRAVPARSGSVFCLRVKFVAVDAALLQGPRVATLSLLLLPVHLRPLLPQLLLAVQLAGCGGRQAQVAARSRRLLLQAG